jgi:SAM-dependent methyltransferase
MTGGSRVRRLARKILRSNDGSSWDLGKKQESEVKFWQKEIRKYRNWLNGELDLLYKTHSPEAQQVIRRADETDTSVLTWHRLHQEPKYLAELDLEEIAFEGMRVLDVGSGPMPSATCFKRCELYCLESLLPAYLLAGFPLHHYAGVRFVHGTGESMPLEDNYFDAVISVNAIDHVDDFGQTAREIGRVCKPDGLLRVQAHYHAQTVCEPLELNDEIFAAAFSWCPGLKKINEKQEGFSADLPANESYALWSNF